MNIRLPTVVASLAIAVAVGSVIAVAPARAATGVDTKGKAVKIAVVGPLTGQYGVFGQDQKRGAEIAIEEINKAGGFKQGPYKGYQVRAEYFDDKGDPKESTNVAQQIVIGDFFAEIGPTNSSPANASAPIYNRANVPMVLVYASDSRLTHSGYKNVFRMICTTDTEGAAYARHAVNTLKGTKIAEIWENTAWGQGVHKSFSATLKDLKAELVASETFVVGQDVDFKAILTKMRALNPDVLMLDVTYNEGGMIVSQARAMGWEVPMLASTSCNAPKFQAMMPQDPGTVYLAPVFNQLSSDPVIAAFVQSYKQRFGDIPSEPAALAYDAVHALAAGIESGATKREDLKDHLRNIQFKGVTNQIRFDANGDVMQPNLPLWKLKGDKTWTPVDGAAGTASAAVNNR